MLTEEQIKERKAGIGGSDVGAILGINKFKSIQDVYLEKTSDVVWHVDEKSLIKMRMGSYLEPFIILLFEELNNKKVTTPKEHFKHPIYPFMQANVDGLVDDGSILECKYVSKNNKKEWGEEGTDEFPLNYKAQVAHYCIVTGRYKAYLAVLIEGNYKQYIYNLTKEDHDNIISKEEDFWNNYVLKNFMPI